MYGTGQDVFQICHEQPDGRMWVRSGNADGFRAWRQIADGSSAITMNGVTTFAGTVNANGTTYINGPIKKTDTLYPVYSLCPSTAKGNGKTFLGTIEGSYYGAIHLIAWNSASDSNNRRLLSLYDSDASGLSEAIRLRTCVDGSWNEYRVFHSGMTNAVQPSDTGWILLTLASGVSAATQYAEYFGAAYRVVNGNHVHVRCGVSFNYAGARMALTSTAIPEAYRPKNGAYAFCVGTLSRLYRIVVNTSGIIELEWANALGSSSTSGSFSVSWMDGRVDYFI